MRKILFHIKRFLKIPELIPFLIFFIGIIEIESKVVSQGDDLMFMELAKKMTILDFLKYRFYNWSGRLSVESALYFLSAHNFYFWKLINFLVIAGLMIFLYRFFQHSDSIEGKIKEADKFEDNNKIIYLKRFFMAFFFCLSVIIFKGLYKSVVFDITVSVNYLWPLCAGVFALVPFVLFYRGRLNPKSPLTIFTLFCTVFACLGQEQVSFMVIMLMCFANLLLYFKIHKLNPYLIIQTIIAFVSGCILFFAPGNRVRYFAEINVRYKDFLQLSLMDHVLAGMKWMMQYITSKDHLLFLFWIVLSVVLFVRVKNKSGLIRISPIIPATAVFIILIEDVFILMNFNIGFLTGPAHIFNSIFFDFTRLQTIGNISLSELLPYIFWSTIFISPAFLIPYTTSGISSKICVFAYLLSFASLVLMFASPTMFASGYRVYFQFVFTLYAIMIKLLFDNRKCLLKLVLNHVKISNCIILK